MGGTRFIGGWLVLGSFIALAANACGEDSTPGATNPNGVDGGGTDGSTNETGPVTPSDGSVIVPTGGPIDPTVAAQAAVVLASCITEFEAESVLEQIYSRIRDGFSDYRGIANCIASRKNGCQAITDCTGVSADLTGPCEDSCIGNVAEGCDDQFKARVDCTLQGGRICTTTTTGSTGCILPGALPCDSSSQSSSRCGPDNRPITCSLQHEEPGPDCAKYGLTCSAARAQCAGTEGACSSVYGGGSQIVYEGKSCVGPKLSACVGDGLTTLDCETLVVGSTCQSLGVDGGTMAYCGLGTQCKPGDPYQGACDGDSVVVCNGGRIDNVDCKALGFTGCMSSGKYAFCSPSLKATALAMQGDGG